MSCIKNQAIQEIKDQNQTHQHIQHAVPLLRDDGIMVADEVASDEHL